MGNIIVLFLENLNQIIGEQMNEREVRRLRSLLQKENRFIVVATAPLVFPEVSKHEQPFFNFFEVIYLFELTRDELKELLRLIAEIENNKQFLRKLGDLEYKINAITTLTGGNPRIAILLYDLTSEGKITDVEKTFFKILDENTPYYQDIFRMLSGGQRKIFDTLISFGRPATPKEIAARTRLDRGVVNSQIRRLEKDGYVISHRMGRTTKYEVRERLFRLWRELRRRPFGREKLSILVEFLELWYSAEERREMLLKCWKHLYETKDQQVFREARYWFLSLPHKHKEELLPMLVKESYRLGKMQMLNDLVYDKKLKEKVLKTEMVFLLENKKYEELLDVIDKRVVSFESVALPRRIRRLILLLLGRHEEALEAASKAIELNPDDGEAWTTKATALGSLGRHEEASAAFLKASKLTSETSVCKPFESSSTEQKSTRKRKKRQAIHESGTIQSGSQRPWDLRHRRILQKND